MEKETRDADPEQQVLKPYVKATEEYVDSQLSVSPLSHDDVLSLRDALLDHFSYTYIAKELEPVSDKAKLLGNSLEGIRTLSDTINAVLDNAGQRTNTRLELRTNVLSILVGVLAFIGLAEFIPAAQLTKETYPAFLHSKVVQLDTLANVARVVIATVGLITVCVKSYYAVLWARERLLPLFWIRNRVPRPQKQFGTEVGTLWDLANAAEGFSANEAWKKVEDVDGRATRRLPVLLERIERVRSGQRSRPTRLLRSLKRFKGKQTDEWLDRARYTRYRIDLFVLCPEVIALPRTLCVLWCKNRDFFAQPTISDQTFDDSLKRLPFEQRDIDRLKYWLSSPDNEERIRKFSVSELVSRLERRGLQPTRRRECLPDGKVLSTGTAS